MTAYGQFLGLRMSCCKDGKIDIPAYVKIWVEVPSQKELNVTSSVCGMLNVTGTMGLVVGMVTLISVVIGAIVVAGATDVTPATMTDTRSETEAKRPSRPPPQPTIHESIGEPSHTNGNMMAVHSSSQTRKEM